VTFLAVTVTAVVSVVYSSALMRHSCLSVRPNVRLWF